jgi:hypothetical protein
VFVSRQQVFTVRGALEGDDLILLNGTRGIFYFGIFSEGEGILERASLRRLILVLIAGI